MAINIIVNWDVQHIFNVETSFYDFEDTGNWVDIVFTNGGNVSLQNGHNEPIEIVGDVDILRIEMLYNGIVNEESIINISGKTATVRIRNANNVEVVMNIITTESSSDTIGFNHNYIVSNENMADLSSYRFESIGSDIDKSMFIISVVELPFPRSMFKNIETIENNIVLGSFITEIVSERMSSDVIEIDLGTIDVESSFNNSLDFIESECYLYLPYIDVIELDVSKVVGYVISITLGIDVYSGESNVYVRSSYNNKLIHIENVVLGRVIPFVKKEDTIISELQSKLIVDNSITIPEIEIVRSENAISSNNILTLKEGTLINAEGYVEIDVINLMCKATLNEKNNIVNILKGGVFIK